MRLLEKTNQINFMAYQDWLREKGYLTTPEEDVELENGFEDRETANRLADEQAELSLINLSE
jgi:hypothetical protein